MSEQAEEKKTASGESVEGHAGDDSLSQDLSPSRAASGPDARAGASGSAVSFSKSITIFPDRPIPDRDRGKVRAYAAKGGGNARIPQNLFALVCEDDLTPRWHVGIKYARVMTPSLVRLVGSGPVYWPPAKKQKYVFVYENNLGRPVLKDDEKTGLGMDPDRVMTAVVRPMIGVLQEFRNNDIVHNAIRPSNMYDGGVSAFESVILGECLCVPPSYNMGVLYETVERAMSDPVARGMGTHEDDLYAFGVSLAIMLRTPGLFPKVTEEDIIRQKIEVGTYVALTGKDRFTGAILELLRGLLHDDKRQRWNLDEIQAWYDGRRLSPKQSMRRSKAPRPISFNNKKYFRPEFLAMDLVENVAEALQLTESKALEQWVTRALEDKRVQADLEVTDELSVGQGGHVKYDEEYVTRVAMALHPGAPIRFRDLRVMPDGVGNALLAGYLNKEDIKQYADFFIAFFAMHWLTMQEGSVSDASTIINKFDSCRAHLRQASIGYGLERCLYFLNTQAPCISSSLRNYFVRNPEDLMFAYEDMASSGDRPEMFIDRHIAAFLSVKDRKNIDPYFLDLNSEEKHRRVLGEMMTLATIQTRSKLQNFPGITDWMGDNLGYIFERIHDRNLRDDLEKRVNKYRKKGDLSKMAALFDQSAMYDEDKKSFFKAMRDYRKLSREREDLDKKLNTEKSYGIEVGKQVAAVVSAALAGFFILAFAIMTFAGGLSFN